MPARCIQLRIILRYGVTGNESDPPHRAAIVLAAAEALAADRLTRDEIGRLPFMAASDYDEAIAAYCLPEWHYASNWGLAGSNSGRT